MFYRLSHCTNQEKTSVLGGKSLALVKSSEPRTSQRPFMGKDKHASLMESILVDMEREGGHG